MRFWLTPFFVLVSVFLWKNQVEAKVFDFQNLTFGSYIKGNYSTAQPGDSIYDARAGADTSFSASPQFVLGGEFGFIIRTGPIGFRLGLHVTSPETMSDIEGKNSTATLMRVTSNVTGILGAGHVEFYIWENEVMSFWVSGGGGAGNVTVLNKYDLTAEGRTEFSVNDYTEEYQGVATMGEGAVGFEFHIGADTTMFIDAGYRYMQVQTFKHVRGNITAIPGGVAEGQTVSANGTNLGLDLSGPFAGIGFRFYLR